MSGKGKASNEQINFLSQLDLAVKTGKYVCGYDESMDSVIKGTSKCIILAKNAPENMRMLLEYYSTLNGCSIVKNYSGTNNELKSLLRLKHRTSVISIIDQGEADKLMSVE